MIFGDMLKALGAGRFVGTPEMIQAGQYVRQEGVGLDASFLLCVGQDAAGQPYEFTTTDVTRTDWDITFPPAPASSPAEARVGIPVALFTPGGKAATAAIITAVGEAQTVALICFPPSGQTYTLADVPFVGDKTDAGRGWRFP